MTFIKKILWNNCFFSKWKYIVEKYKIVCYNEYIKKYTGGKNYVRIWQKKQRKRNSV